MQLDILNIFVTSLGSQNTKADIFNEAVTSTLWICFLILLFTFYRLNLDFFMFNKWYMISAIYFIWFLAEFLNEMKKIKCGLLFSIVNGHWNKRSKNSILLQRKLSLFINNMIMYKIWQNLQKKTLNKSVYQGCMIHDQYKKINCVFVHSQWKLGN